MSLPPSIQPTTLTPQSRNAETTHDAMVEGTMNGILTLLPSIAAVAVAMKKSPTFVARTNWQSRTALAIMPASFVTVLTAEQKFVHKMREIAAETEHTIKTVHWAEDQLNEQHKMKLQQQPKETNMTMSTPYGHHHHATEQEISELYKQSLMNRNEKLCIVPGDTLQIHHRAANYIAENPIKILASLAIPSVAWIFYGTNQKEHLQFSMKLLQTRVIGQFTTICMLISVFGFKDFMDNHGKYISQADADQRVEEMQLVRRQLIQRLQIEHEHEEQLQRELKEAIEADQREHKVHHQPKKNKKPIMNVTGLVEDAAV